MGKPVRWIRISLIYFVFHENRRNLPNGLRPIMTIFFVRGPLTRTAVYSVALNFYSINAFAIIVINSEFISTFFIDKNS